MSFRLGFTRNFVALAALLPLSGCMLATQKDILTLNDNLTAMRKTQADLVVKMTDLSSNLESLNSQLDSSQQRMTSLSQKLEDLQADLTRRMSVLSGQMTGGSPSAGLTSNPGDIYRLALNDYQAGKFDLALIGFRNFMAQYPRSELAPQAQYQVGECEFARKNFLDAAREYDKVVQSSPKSDIAPKALYKKGIALQSAGRDSDARDTFRRVIKDYPHHEVAKSAKDLLENK
jgi:tol-pal system protein YbgF